MKFINTLDASEELHLLAWLLVEHSFPLEEQRPYSEHLKALSDPAFHADIIVDEEGDFVGVMFYWIYDEDYCFVEHFAIDHNIRGGGYGKRAMNILLEKGYVILLEIEPPTDEITIRRKHFYERLGFIQNDYLHIHPSYRPDTKAHELKVMSNKRLLTIEEFKRFRDYSLNHILKYANKQDAFEHL